MKNRFRVAAAAALLAAGVVGACASDTKPSTMNDDGMSKSTMAMEHKTCSKCGMECDANGMCPHCDAAKMHDSKMMK